jgi:SAM-dependent methyltransferase
MPTIPPDRAGVPGRAAVSEPPAASGRAAVSDRAAVSESAIASESPAAAGRAAVSERESHQAREVAESFGADAERYDRARPSYPSALVERIIATSPGTDVLDVGCGTGIAARLFQAAGCRVLGVDVDERMAGLARRRGLDVEVAKFEDWDPAGRTFDAVVAGQAWHWVDPVAGAALAARVLRPGGRLAVFWNSFQPPAPLAEAFTAVYRRVLAEAPLFKMPSPGADAYGALSEKAADGMRRAVALGKVEQWRFEWDRFYPRDEFLDQLPTSGFVNQLPPATLQELVTGIGAAIDAAGGGFTMGYTTVVVTAVKIRTGPDQ